MSFNNIHMVNEYIENIPWYGMEYVLRFVFVHLSMFACLFVSVVVRKSIHEWWWWAIEEITKILSIFNVWIIHSWASFIVIIK
jgi:hypothetical protein